MRGINEENCDPQAVRKARVRARVTARGSRVRGGQREVAKREMRSEIQRRRGRTSLCVCACEGEVHPSCGFPYQTDVHPFRERGGCGGRRAIYYLGGFQKCLLFSKAEVFRVKTVPALLFSTAPQISCTLTCTLFFFFRRRRMAPKHLAGILGETRTLREPSSFCAPKAPSCK